MEQPTSYGFRLGYKFEEHKDREVGVNRHPMGMHLGKGLEEAG